MFKALTAKFRIEGINSNQIKKEILEMYIQEKEEEWFLQNKSEFFDTQGNYYFHFLEKQELQGFFFFFQKIQ